MRPDPEDNSCRGLARWCRITRAPFLTATLVPVLLGGALARSHGFDLNLPWFVLTLFSAALLHIGTNTLNDYFDHRSGADAANEGYIAPFTGGSRTIQSGLISPRGMFTVSVVSFVAGLLIAMPLLYRVGMPVLYLGAAGLASGVFYTAPPLRFAARKGLGELLIGLNLGPLMVAGSALIQTGTLEWSAFLAGIPIGLLVTAIIYMNEFPDYAADKAAEKKTLIVCLGPQRARIGYVLIVAAAFLSIVLLVLTGLLPALSLFSFVGIFFAFRAARILYRHYDSRSLRPANLDTIRLHLITGLLLTLGVWLG